MPEEFGMSDQEVQEVARQNLWLKIKIIFASVEPFLVKMFNVTVYYSIKLIKAFVSESMRMITGKEIE